MGQKIYESDKFLKTGGTSSQYLMADGTTSTGPTGGVDVGTGTANTVAKFSDSDTITDSIITDDGTNVLINGNLGIGVGDSDNLFHIEATDNSYDVSRAMEIDYTKSHTTTGWGASVFGARVNVYADGVGQQADVQGGSFSATHNGSGISYYLLGSQSNANHSGSGNTGAIWGAYNRGKVSGSGTGTHPFLIGTNQVAELNNANASVGRMQSIVAYSKTTSGDITGRLVGAEIGLDCNQGSATAVDAAVLHLEADVSNLTVSGNARTINSVSTLPSVFAGTIEADELIKTGGTSSQFLKADGSVDSTVYSTTDTQLTTEEVQDIVGAMVQSNTEQSISVTYSDGDGKLNFDAGAATYTHPGETAFTVAVDTGALTGAVVVSDIDMNITTNAFGHVEDAAMAVATRTLTLADLGFTGDADATNDQVLPTDFVSAASGGSFGGDVTVDANARITSRVAVGGDFAPQKALHLKNAAPVFRFEDSDITGGYLDMIKSSRNMRFDLEQDDATTATNFNFRIGGTTHLYMKNNFVGIMNDSPTEALDVTGDVLADGFKIPGGTSARFLKADGSTDSTQYLSGAGTSGNIPIYDSANVLIDNSDLSFNFITSKVTMGADLDVVGDIAAADISASNVTADSYHNQQVILTSNFNHTSNNALSYYSMPFNSLGESITEGEQHFFVSPGNYRLRTIIMRNTSTGSTLTATSNTFRVVKNGSTLWTGSSNFFGSGQGAYSANSLNDSDATWALGDMIQFEFTTNGDWKDVAATMVLELI